MNLRIDVDFSGKILMVTTWKISSLNWNFDSFR